MTSKGLYGTFLVRQDRLNPTIYHLALECGAGYDERATIALTRTGPLSNQFTRSRSAIGKARISDMAVLSEDGNDVNFEGTYGDSLYWFSLIFIAQHNLLGVPRSARQAFSVKAHVGS